MTLPPGAGTAPPSSIGAGTAPPPSSDAGTAPPPSSDAGTAPPPSTDAGTAPPPSSDAGTAPPPSADAGNAPPSSTGAGNPPSAPPGAPPCRPAALAFARTIRRLRWLILPLWALIIAVGLTQMEEIIHSSDVLVYFDHSGTERQDFEAVTDRFGRGGEVVTLIVPDDGDVLAPAGLTAMARLTAASLSRPDVTAVRSPLSAVAAAPGAVLAMDDDALRRLAREIRRAVNQNPGDYRPLIAPDGRVAAVAAIVESPDDNALVEALAAEHRALKEAVGAASPGITLMQTGRLIIDAAFLTEGKNDVENFAGTQFLLMLALLFAAFGSASVVSLMSLLTFAILATILGTIGASGIAINGISSATPAVLMGLVIATSVHVVMAWQKAIREGADRLTAVAIAYDRNGRPVVISLVTTMISFLLLNIAESPPFRQLGNLVALGLIYTFVIVFTLLPAMLLTLPQSRGHHRLPFEAAMGWLGQAVAARWRLFLLATAVAATASIVGAASLKVDDTFSHYFDETYEVRRATDLYEAALSGTTIIDVAVDTEAPGGAFTPTHLERVAQFDAWLDARPEVAGTTSLADAAARADGRPLGPVVDAMARNGVPRLASADGRHGRISIVMRGVSSRDTLAFADDVRTAAGDIFPGRPVIVTGIPVLSAQLSVKSTHAMFVGMGLALAAISALIMVTLRSVRLGLISLAPNLLPVTMAFGVWGLFAGEISFAATVVGALTYGIVVDDTVHVLARYRRLRDDGLDTLAAMHTAYRTVGAAVVVTSLAIGLSYLPFALSGFLVNRHFGALTALTLMAALIADLLFLPALLAALDRMRPGRRTPQLSPTSPGPSSRAARAGSGVA